MNTSPCAYCGALAEKPVQLAFAIDDDEDEGISLRLPLCVACSQSWCTQPPSAHFGLAA